MGLNTLTIIREENNVLPPLSNFIGLMGHQIFLKPPQKSTIKYICPLEEYGYH